MAFVGRRDSTGGRRTNVDQRNRSQNPRGGGIYMSHGGGSVYSFVPFSQYAVGRIVI